MKKTKQALLLSAISLLLCISMLIGTTFAWFTDSVSSVNNIIKSGNLDVVLEYKTEWSDGWQEVGTDPLFDDEALYEPGYTETVFLRVSNAGSLALKYELVVEIIEEIEGTNVYNESFKLSDSLQIGSYIQNEIVDGANDADILFPSMFGSRAAAKSNISNFTKLENVTYGVDIVLLPGEDTAQVVALVLHMPETVGNEANHLTGTEPPQITLGINLFATQVPHEEDSFGSDYDADATYDETTGGNPGNPGAGNPGAGNPDDPVDIRVLGTGGFRGTNWNAAESGWNIREYLALPFDVEDPNMGTITVQPAQGTTPSVPNGGIYTGTVSGTEMTGPVTSIGDVAATETSEILWVGVTEVTLGSGNLAIMHRTLPVGTIVNVQADTTLDGTKSSAFGADYATYADSTPLVTFRVACDESDLETSDFYASLESIFGGSIPSSVVIEAVGA